MKINNQEEFDKAILEYSIPKEIILDIKNRISNWVLSGGSLNDHYVKQQYRFIENYINLKYRII